MRHTYQVYFGGDLFNHKDLIGNALLSSYIEKCSNGKYKCYLPQSLDQSHATAMDIRNQDLIKIIECDLALFNFDGAELDSGTVVEFIFAKFLDIPSVVLRSDFRSSGEKDLGGEDWNLMCSFYPRTEVVQFSAIAYYQKAMNESSSLSEAENRLYAKIAKEIIDGFDTVKARSPLLADNKEQMETLYQWALRFPGSGLERFCDNREKLHKIVRQKREKGLI
ncbi:MAG TPA: nucleoside 2-deoxyribosyltransferase [Deltaproteobacteria bacterium]|nr:nucleoside 2-deoxyribosyltransferase [Deltaproteobacteria bacterium]